MRLLICAGASGGGVYPALAVLQALQDEADEVLWAGSQGGMEAELVGREQIPYTEIPAAGVHGVGLQAMPGNIVELGRGYRAADRLLKSYKPDVLFFTGGYVAVPVALAGRKLPVVLFVPDIEPGLALRSIGRFADHIAVPVEDSHSYFRSGSPVTTTGYPVRREIAGWQREAGRTEFDLSPDEPVLLVFGGSKGARSINLALLDSLDLLLPKMQILHITGHLDWPKIESAAAELSDDLKDRYRAYPYLHKRMGAALASADLVVSRAGASILGEYPAYGLPAVLVPYPHAWRYQRVNAEYLVDRGGGVIVNDEDLADRLASVVLKLMTDKEKREQMRIATKKLYRSEAADEISRLIIAAAGRVVSRSTA